MGMQSLKTKRNASEAPVKKRRKKTVKVTLKGDKIANSVDVLLNVKAPQPLWDQYKEKLKVTNSEWKKEIHNGIKRLSYSSKLPYSEVSKTHLPTKIEHHVNPLEKFKSKPIIKSLISSNPFGCCFSRSNKDEETKVVDCPNLNCSRRWHDSCLME